VTRFDLRFDDVVAHLYSVSPEEFVAERTAAAGRAKEAGDRPLGVRIAKLRKPTVAAWLVNLLAHRRPDLIGELLALGDELRSAQRELRGESLRELSIRRRDTVAALAREARSLAVAAGRSPGEKLPLAEVEQTLTAALADGFVADEVRAGVLTRPTNYAGFGELPRPQLRLLQGGRDSDGYTGPDSDTDSDTGRDTGSDTGRGVGRDTGRDDGGGDTGWDARPSRERPIGHLPVPERPDFDAPGPESAKPGRTRTVPVKKDEKEKLAERKRAIEHARATKTARRELLSASMQLVDAQAKRDAAMKAMAAADKAMAAAQQRADEAKAVLDKLTAQ
jgi:hypothetical protein